jgi:CheY-like chemotaxis protein
MAKAEGGLRIVVADDNTFMANSLKVLLELWGHSVTPVYDGRAALSLIRDLRPDIALLDLRMPQIDGLEVARRVRAEPSPTPETVVLIAVTGSADPSDRVRTRAAGFDEHLVKPIDLQELRELLRLPRREPARSGVAAASPVGGRPVV